MTTSERKAAFLASLRGMDRAQLENVLANVQRTVEELQERQEESVKLDEDVFGELRELL